MFSRLHAARRRRRARKKARLAAMSRARRITRRVVIPGTWLLGFVAALMVASIALFYVLTNVPKATSLPLPQVATIEYSNGSVLARVGPVDRTIVPLSRVPASVRNAVLAAEDRGFYSEPGISIHGTMRAAWHDLTGGATQGGSGITQQYVKNAYLNDQQTLSRKLKELMIAVKLSREYSKDQILSFYLNTVYFGRNTYGIEAASEAFFGKDVSKLSSAQGALLAGLLRAPSYYDPANNPRAARARWHYVIDGIVSMGTLPQARANELRFPKTLPPDSSSQKLGAKGWRYLLVNAVLADLQAHGISAGEVYAKGLTIRTTIDQRAQHDALAAIHQTFTGLSKQQRNLKHALTAVRPSDGAVLAYYGGTGPGVNGYDGKVDYNDYASRGFRPPGSSFKPYTLATVLTQTLHSSDTRIPYTINSVVDGSFCTTIEGTRICNDPGDQPYSSPRVSIRAAMKYSLNTTFDQLASEVGPANVAVTAHGMGIAEHDPQGNRTLVGPRGTTTFGIGIGDYPVSPLDQAVGFATLANDGMRNHPYFVKRATASSGAVVYTHRVQPAAALDPRVANDVTLTLKPVAAWSGDALADGRPSAAKTGTEGVGPNSANNSDAWMVGYTPQVSAAVWVGTGYNRPIFNAAGQPLYGADLPGQTWQRFMDLYLAGKPQLPLASHQQVYPNGHRPPPSHSVAPPTTTAPTTHSPSPTLSSTAGSSSPSSPARPSPTTHSPSPSPTPTTGSPSPTGTCGGALQPPCTSSPAPTSPGRSSPSSSSPGPLSAAPASLDSPVAAPSG